MKKSPEKMGRDVGNTAAGLSLPPGFRFYPTDEELVVHYLCRKVAGHHFSLQIIGEIDLYKFDPWILPGKALFGEKEWYFFSPRDRKYPNGSRPNRVAGSGFWKATGTDKIITVDGRRVGIKKALVFYTGKAPKGTKTNWIMHEYRLADKSNRLAKKGSLRLDEWVLCRIYKKKSGNQKSFPAKEQTDDSSCFEEVLDWLPGIDEQVFQLPRLNSLKSLPDENLNIQNFGAGKMDWCSWKDQAEITAKYQQQQLQQQQQQNSNCATDPNLGAVTEIGSTGKLTGGVDNIYFTGIPPLYGIKSQENSIEEEVQSGFRLQQIDNQIYGQSLSHLLDPYAVTNPGLMVAGNFRGNGTSGFRQ